MPGFCHIGKTMSEFKLVGSPTIKLPQHFYRIKYAEITDTRLMGVLGMHVYWKAEESQALDHFLSEKQAVIDDYIAEYHQIYYYEAEENGLETVTEIWGDDKKALTVVENRYFGGLGSEKMHFLTENEALFMIRKFVDDTKSRTGRTIEALNADDDLMEGEMDRDGMPKSLAELYRNLQGKKLLYPEEEERLMLRICAPINNDCAVINYYLMRCYGHDPEGAKLLESPFANKKNLQKVELPERAVLRKNSIQKQIAGNGQEFYLSESLLECTDSFYVAFSELEISDKRVISAKVNSSFAISDMEAARMLRRPEYIACFRVNGLEGMAAENMLDELLPRANRKFFDGGVLYMEYNSDNSHVEKPVYNLADDVSVSYFLTNADQLLVAANSPSSIMSAELLMRMSRFGKHLESAGRYNFAHPLLGDFIDSGYDDFDEFLRYLM